MATANLDFDALERLVDNAGRDTGGQQKARERSRSRDRDRKRRRDEEVREPAEGGRRDERKARQQEGEERRREKEEMDERQKQLDDATRMDRTVMIVGLNLRSDERDIYEFFLGRAGTVRDVQIIRDARTGRSKGVAYVELATNESMVKALHLSGQNLQGSAIRVQATQQYTDGRGTHASGGRR